MNAFDAQRMALELMRQHGLTDQGWSFYFDRARRRFGCCRYTVKAITLSRPLTELSSETEVRDTILHEIAHALTPGAGHGWQWRAKCREIGAKPQRCAAQDAPSVKGRHRLTCRGCGHVMTAHRAGRKIQMARAGIAWHGPCGREKGRLDYSYKVS